MLRLATPLGADQLLPERVTILEGVNHLFEIRIAARAKPEAMKRELYEYPARIGSVAEAERARKLRMQASEADFDRVSGASTSRVLEAGRGAYGKVTE